MSSAPILVHGATGFTGRLVCAALSRRGIPFAAGGRDPAKLAALAERHRCETVRIDLGVADTVVAAIRGRAAVLACAGPFIEVGEPVLATCAREE
ncbi:MAG: NAD(P)H-binding protein [Polyangiaceae bacterium]